MAEKPGVDRAREPARLLRLIRALFIASQWYLRRAARVPGPARSGRDLQQASRCRLMRANGLRALHGYRTAALVRRQAFCLDPNILQRDSRCATEQGLGHRFTYIRTWQGGCIWPWSWICSHARSSAGRRARRSPRARARRRADGRARRAARHAHPLGSRLPVRERCLEALLPPNDLEPSMSRRAIAGIMPSRNPSSAA